MPIVRYRTRDLTRLLPPTSRSFRPMGKIVGRSDDMMIIRGVNVFPTQVEEIVLAHKSLSGLYQVHVSRADKLDQVEVHCELNPADAAAADRTAIGEWVQHRVKTLIGISTRVVVHAPNEMERTQTGKARRVIDTRPR